MTLLDLLDFEDHETVRFFSDSRIICVANQYLGERSESELIARIGQIPAALRAIFDQAAAGGLATNIVADDMAHERLLKEPRPVNARAASPNCDKTLNGRDRVARTDS
jgi:hypothetical protein